MEAARARRPQDLLLSSRTSRAGRRGLASGSTTSSQRSRLLLRTVGGSTLFGRCPTVRDWRESTWGEATLFGKASLRLLALLEASGGSVSTPSGQHCGSTNKKRRSIAFRGQPACTLGDVGSPRTSQLPQLPRHPRLHRQRRQLLQLPQQLQPHRQVLRQLPQVPRHPRLHCQRRQLLQLPQQPAASGKKGAAPAAPPPQHVATAASLLMGKSSGARPLGKGKGKAVAKAAGGPPIQNKGQFKGKGKGKGKGGPPPWSAWSSPVAPAAGGKPSAGGPEGAAPAVLGEPAAPAAEGKPSAGGKGAAEGKPSPASPVAAGRWQGRWQRQRPVRH